MDHEENYYRTVEFREPEYIICNVSLLAGTWSRYKGELEDLVERHPIIFGKRERDPDRDYDAFSGTYAEGLHTDNWGCVWKNIRGGMDSQVIECPLDDWSKLDTYRPPTEGGLSHGFMYQRLYYLRGFESFMMDLVEEPPQLQQLIDMVLTYNLGEVAKMLKDKPRMVHFGDDMGNQDRLPMSPATWRKYLKPCFAKIFGTCRDAGAYVYLHSDGHILDIIPDLIECGLTVINPQYRANTLEGLERVCKGKICMNLDLDRQMFPFCTPADIDNHVREAIATLGSKEGGLMVSAECAPDVPLENIEAISQAFEKYRAYYQ